MTAIQAAIAKGLMDQGGKHTGTIDRIIDNMTQGSTGSATAGRSWVEDALGEGVRGWNAFKRLFDGPERDFNSAWEYQTKPRGNQ
ncbi:MAG TPA: hypothetical protein EYN66_05160 [Myxococcales bacterium]|nr:hypothetical protein [Myxococcales bacterium]